MTAASGLDITCHSAFLAIEALDEARIVDALSADDDAGIRAWIERHPFTCYDHLVLATRREDGEAVAILGARETRTAEEPVLLLETAFVRPSGRGRHVLQKMAAALLLRVAGLGEPPKVIAARTADPEWMELLRGLAARFQGAACYPQAEDAPVALRSAGLARRIARTLHPSLRFEVATSTLKGALAVQGGIGLGRVATGRGGAAETRFSTYLMPVDQTLMLIDLRSVPDEGIEENARQVWRRR